MEDNKEYAYVYLDKDLLDIEGATVPLVRTEALYVKHPGWETVVK